MSDQTAADDYCDIYSGCQTCDWRQHLRLPNPVNASSGGACPKCGGKTRTTWGAAKPPEWWEKVPTR